MILSQGAKGNRACLPNSIMMLHQPRGQARRWTDEEHEEFVAAVGRFGKRWKTVAEHVPSKTAAQVRTHATKYFSKLKERQDLSDPAAMLLQLAAASPAARVASAVALTHSPVL